MDTETIWDLERSFWIDGAKAYEANLHDAAVMVFPGLGIMDRAAIIESIQQGARWNDVQMTKRRLIAADGTAVLVYAAEAEREGAKSYRSLCISTYVLRPGGWRMVSHQQTAV